MFEFRKHFFYSFLLLFFSIILTGKKNLNCLYMFHSFILLLALLLPSLFFFTPFWYINLMKETHARYRAGTIFRNNNWFILLVSVYMLLITFTNIHKICICSLYLLHVSCGGFCQIYFGDVLKWGYLKIKIFGD